MIHRVGGYFGDIGLRKGAAVVYTLMGTCREEWDSIQIPQAYTIRFFFRPCRFTLTFLVVDHDFHFYSGHILSYFVPSTIPATP